MVRLSADLILESPQYFNPLREREIDLRGELFFVVLPEGSGIASLEDAPNLCQIPLKECVRIPPASYESEMSVWILQVLRHFIYFLLRSHNRVPSCFASVMRIAGNKIAVIENLGATEVRSCCQHHSSYPGVSFLFLNF